jgi:hypothetical protein
MKKIILVILSTILFASNTVVLKKKQKETNTSTVNEEIILRKWLIDKINAIMPEYLQAEPKENMFNFSVSYDTYTKKTHSKLNLRLFFPSVEGQYSKSTLTKTKTIKIKLLPILQIYKKLPCLTLKGSLSIKNETLLKNVTFNETIYYYTTFTEYKEITTLAFNRFVDINNLTFKISKTYLSTDKKNISYVFGLYYYIDFYKFIRIYGYEMGGQRKKDPFIYYYKLFFTYRHILFNKRYIFLELTPYLLVSKEFNFNPKIFASASFNVKF